MKFLLYNLVHAHFSYYVGAADQEGWGWVRVGPQNIGPPQFKICFAIPGHMKSDIFTILH